MIRQKVVYFIRPIGMSGPIKIGTSVDPEKRLRDISVWSPLPLEIIGKFPGSAAQENYLHRRFADQHSHGEWFRPSELLLWTIERILAGEPLASVCAGIPDGPPSPLKSFRTKRPGSGRRRRRVNSRAYLALGAQP